MSNKKNLIGYLALTLAVLLFIIPYFYPSHLLLSIFGVMVAILAAIVWGTEGGIIVMFLLASITLSMFFKSSEILLFGVSATIITIAITSRLRGAVKSLRRSKRKYRSIVNNVSGAVYSQKTEGGKQITFLSDYFKDIAGYQPEIFLSGDKKLHDIVHAEDWAWVKREIERKVESKDPWNIEYRIIGSDGKIKWVNERGRMVLNGEGKFLIEGIIFEITNRKMMEQALKESEAKYRNLVERANDGIIIVQEGKIKYVNPRITEILGYRIEEIEEKPFRDYIIEEETDRFLERYKKTEEGRVPLIYETVLVDKTGRKVFTEMNSGFIDYEGKLADLIIIRDISQRKQIEEIVHQREQEFKNLVERAPDIIARFDNEFRYVYINPAVEKDLGIRPRDIFWKTPRDAGVPEDIAQIWEEALETVFNTEKEKSIYTEHLNFEERKYYYTRLLPEFDKEGKVRTVLAISRDITEAKKIDKVKSEFISVSSHQLRTPLSVIRWCTIMFLDGMIGKITKEQKDYLNKIYESTRKLIKISNAFFNVAILDLGILSVIPKEVDIVNIVKDSIKDLEIEKSEKETKISEKYEKNLPLIKADERILRTIFRGLLSNAIKYGYQGGNAWIEISKQEKDILVKISDDGLGVPADQQSKIFTKFFRAENIRDKEIYGTGLDLHIIKEIIINFEGNIWFESPNPDIGKKSRKGTSFYFTIPLRGMKRRKGEKGLTD